MNFERKIDRWLHPFGRPVLVEEDSDGTVVKTKFVEPKQRLSEDEALMKRIRDMLDKGHRARLTWHHPESDK